MCDEQMQKIVFKSMLLERTDSDFIACSKILYDVKQFDRQVVRANTAYLYTQSKFNLLREETEGFSKLLTLLSESLPPTLESFWRPPLSADTASITRAQMEKQRKEVVSNSAKRLLSRIQALIGAFELDSNRVLDLVLDVFIAKVTDQYDFFLELLEISPWNPQKNQSRLLSHILGFKFDFYKNTKKDDGGEEANAPRYAVPQQMIWVTALLVKHGMITLGDIYPHLYPDDDQFGKDFDLYQDYLNETGKKAARFQGPGVCISIEIFTLTKLMLT